MVNRTFNKTIAGYHLLMLLSAVDFRFNAEEDRIIRDYLVQEFPFHVNLDDEMEIISNLTPDQWETHFYKCMDDFYKDATQEERMGLLDFAVQLTKADNVITHQENRFLNILFNHWEHEA